MARSHHVNVKMCRDARRGDNLPKVPGPVVLRKCAEHLGVKQPAAAPRGFRGFILEFANDKCYHVLWTLTGRRNEECLSVKPPSQIRCQPTRVEQFLQRNSRPDHKPDVYMPLFVVADRPEQPRLRNPKELGLQVLRQDMKIVQEEDSSVCLFECAGQVAS